MSRAIWITGLPGCGKSTIAEGLKRRYPGFVILGSDELRRVVTPKPTYSEDERDIVYRCLVYAAKILTDLGHDVIIDATGNLRRWRELARELIHGFAEVYLKCPLAECQRREMSRRDTHGAPIDNYRKGREGWPVPGLTVPYEEPENPEVVLETDKMCVEDTVKTLIERLKL
jgi:adenylylsulfate kinase